MTNELEEFKEKVTNTENVVNDLNEVAGSENIHSLLDMLNLFKRKEANLRDEIEKMNELNAVKDDEIADMNVELDAINDYLARSRQE